MINKAQQSFTRLLNPSLKRFSEYGVVAWIGMGFVEQTGHIRPYPRQLFQLPIVLYASAVNDRTVLPRSGNSCRRVKISIVERRRICFSIRREPLELDPEN